MKRHFSQALGAVLHVFTPIRILVIALAAAFFWFFVMGDQGIYQLRKLMEMKNRLMAERQHVNDEIDRLSREKEVLSDPANLEMVIRSELGYIKPGEILFEEKKPEAVRQ